MIYTKQPVGKIMADNTFSQDLAELRKKIGAALDNLRYIEAQMTTEFGDAARCTKLCDATGNKLYEVLSSLHRLERIIPTDYADESYDRGASKLESRIKRLERLLK